MNIRKLIISKSDIKLLKQCESVMDGRDSGMVLNIGRSVLLVLLLVPMAYIALMHMTSWTFGTPKNPMFYWLVLPVVVAPLIEESFKKYAMHRGYGYLFTFIFAIIEGYVYVMAMLAGGVPLALALFVRAKAVCLHMGTIIVQQRFFEKSREENRPCLVWAGFGIAVLLHAGWNLFASM